MDDAPDEAAAAGVRIGVDYPEPLVGHADARLRALALCRVLAPGRPLG